MSSTRFQATERRTVQLTELAGQARLSALTDSERLLRLHKFVARNYRSSLSLCHLAREACVSETYLCEFFKKRVGITLGTWLQIFRLSVAQELLSTTDLPVSDIARRSGFGHPSTLRRAAQRHLRMSPSALREKTKHLRAGMQ